MKKKELTLADGDLCKYATARTTYFFKQRFVTPVMIGAQIRSERKHTRTRKNVFQRAVVAIVRHSVRKKVDIYIDIYIYVRIHICTTQTGSRFCIGVAILREWPFFFEWTRPTRWHYCFGNIACKGLVGRGSRKIKLFLYLYNYERSELRYKLSSVILY